LELIVKFQEILYKDARMQDPRLACWWAFVKLFEMLKSKMADDSHLENRYIAIFQ